MYIDESIKKYIEDVAARKPAPGGGSAAAACGALGIALLEMVCNFSIGNEQYKNVQKDITKLLADLRKLREEFIALVDMDVDAYLAIRSAFKSKDKKIIDKALKDGCYISLKVCELCKSGLEIGRIISEKGNINLVTDVGCGSELLSAAFNSGVFNAEINLKGIEDKEFTQKETSNLDALRKVTALLYEKVITKTKERMK